MKWIDYREKLGIGFLDEEKFRMFTNRIENLFGINDSDYVLNPEEMFHFCNTVGFPFSMVGGYISFYYMDKVLIVLSQYKVSLKDYISCLCALVNNIESVNPVKQKLKDFIEDSLDQCNLQYEIYNKDNEYFVYPSGVKYFDEKLIDNVLNWLVKYPKTFETYKVALEQYNNKIYIRDTADNLRKSLEVFFQEFFSNSKNLDNNIPVIGAYLKEQNADEELRNMLVTLIRSFKIQNDKIVKHNDRIDEKFLEFLLYQTGIFIRMLMVVKNSENK